MYARVFASILDSSLNTSTVPLEARWLWITMILIADEDGTGVVDMPVERLAARASLTVDQTRRALDLLLAPDPESRSEDYEGRRLIPIRDCNGGNGRGWELVNWAKFKAVADKAQAREATRQRVQRYRDKGRVTVGNASVTKSNASDSTPTPDSTPKQEHPAAARPTRALAKMKFTKPTIEELGHEITRRGYEIDPLQFLAYYESNGWKVGKQPMRSWEAALTTWQRRRME